MRQDSLHIDRFSLCPLILTGALLLLLANRQIQGQTEVSGQISGHWTKEASPYLIINDVLIGSDQTLEMDPGVLVQFRDSDDDFVIDGTLLVRGAEGSPVVFTSDDADKESGQWGGLIFREGSDASILEHAVVEFGGGFRAEQLRIENASPTLQSVTLQSSRSSGIGIFGGSPSVVHTTFLNNISYAATLGADAFPSMSGSTASNNGSNTIGRHGGTIRRSGSWSRDQIPYNILNDITISTDAVLMIEPGTTVQFQDADDDLWIDGTLLARGTSAQPIRFTSDEPEQAPGQWGAVLVRNQEEPLRSEFVSCIFEYGGGFRNGMLHCQNADPLVQFGTFQSSRLRGIELTDASPEIRDTVFMENSDYAMGLNTQSFPNLANNSVQNNESNSFAVFGGEIRQAGTWQASDVPFTITNDIRIADTGNLSISPGSIIQFQDTDDDLVVDGALVARGTASRPIRFTSDNPEKAAGQWGRILIRESSDDTTTVFEHCVFEYGGGFQSEILSIEHASPAITHCVFQGSRSRGLTLSDSQAVVTDCHFLSNQGYAFGMTTDSFPSNSTNTGENNGSNSIAILGSTIATSGVWQRDFLPYTVINDVTIAPHVTLTIQPGTTIQFQDRDDDLRIDGALVASGAEDALIRFTSDDAEKFPGQWGAVIFRDSSDDSISRLEWTIFEYGGGFRSGGVELTDAEPAMRDVQFHHSHAHGLAIRGGSPAIEQGWFRDNNEAGIHTSAGATPYIRNSTFSQNGDNGITNSDTSVIVDAINNFWDDPSGPLDTRNDDQLDQTNPNGTGDSVSEFVRWHPSLETSPTAPTEQKPEWTVSPSSIDFDQLNINESIGRDIQISNNGQSELVVHDIHAAMPFEIQLPRLPMRIAPGISDFVTVTFRPVTLGSFSGNITFSSNVGNLPEISVPLSGLSVEPIVSVPKLTKLEPTKGTAGTEVILTGTNFSASLNANTVQIGTFSAELIRVSSTELVARIPAGLSPGTFDLTVTTANQQSNPLPFEVITLSSEPSPLTIAFGNSGQVVISWGPTEPSPKLQTAPAVDPPTTWTNVDGPIHLVDGKMRATVVASGRQSFFRLKKTEPSPDSPGEPSTLRLPEDWTPTFDIIDQGEVLITPNQGGSVQLTNGANVSLPAGALAESATLHIRQLDLSEFTTKLKRDVYQIDVEGHSLLRPATIQFPYKHLNAEGNVVVFHADPGESAEALEPQMDMQSGLLQVETMRFSIFDVEDEGNYGEIFKDVILNPSRSRVLTVPYYSQNLSQWCFAAASQMILKFQGIDVEPWDIAKYFGLPFDSGASIWQLWAGHYRQLFASHGAKVRETTGWLAPENLNGYLIQQLDAGRPVFLVIRHAVHAIVVVGYSQAGIFIHDPSGDALKYGKTTKPPRGQWSRQFLNWDEWSKVINLWPTQYTPIAIPSWAVVLENSAVEEASPATISLPSASINNGRSGGGYIEIDRNDAPNASGLPGGISDSHFFWNGTKPLGYEFLPNKGFVPPDHAAIDDFLLLKADVSNSSTSPIPVSVRVQLANDTIYELETPRIIPPTTNNQLIEIFERIGNFRFTDAPTPIKLGRTTLNFQLLANDQIVDEIPLLLEIGPSRPTGVKKAPAEEGIRITWESVPESLGHRMEYIVTDGFTRRAPTVGRSLLIPSTQGGNLNLDYHVIARDVDSGLEGPQSGPAVLNAALSYSLMEGPTVTGNIDVTTTGVSVLSGPNPQSVTWSSPPGKLIAGEAFTIDFKASPSGPPFKFAPSGPFRDRSTPPGLHPARVSASVTLNPNGPESLGIPTGSARAGYFRISLDVCPPDPATLMYCYETVAEDHMEVLKVPDDVAEFWVVFSVGGLDADITFGEGHVIWKYTADN